MRSSYPLLQLPRPRALYLTSRFTARSLLIPETEAERAPFDRERKFEMTQTPDIDFKPGGGLNNLVSVWGRKMVQLCSVLP